MAWADYNPIFKKIGYLLMVFLVNIATPRSS